MSFSRIQHIAGLPNLFTGTGHNCGRKVIAGLMHFYQEFLPRNSGLFLAALMAKTNVRPFYLPENGKPFHEEIKSAKRPRGPHKIASRVKSGPRATGWTALEYSLSKAHVLPLGMGISEYLAISELFRIAKAQYYSGLN